MMTIHALEQYIKEIYQPQTYAITGDDTNYYQECAMQAIRQLKPTVKTFFEWCVSNPNNMIFLERPWVYDHLSDWDWSRQSVQNLFESIEHIKDTIPKGLFAVFNTAYARNPDSFDSDIWQIYLHGQSKKFPKTLPEDVVKMMEKLPSRRLAEMIIKRWNTKLSIHSYEQDDLHWARLCTRLKPDADTVVNQVLKNAMNLLFRSGQSISSQSSIEHLAANIASVDETAYDLPIMKDCINLIFEIQKHYQVNAKARKILRQTFFQKALDTKNPQHESWSKHIQKILLEHPNIYHGINILIANIEQTNITSLQKFLWDNTTKEEIKTSEDLKTVDDVWKNIFHFSHNTQTREDIIWEYTRYPKNFVNKKMLESPWSKEMKAALFIWIVQRGHHGFASDYGPNMSRRLKKLLVSAWPEWKTTNINTHTKEWIEKAKAFYDISEQALTPGFSILDTSMYNTMPIVQNIVQNKQFELGKMLLDVDSMGTDHTAYP